MDSAEGRVKSGLDGTAGDGIGDAAGDVGAAAEFAATEVII